MSRNTPQTNASYLDRIVLSLEPTLKRYTSLRGIRFKIVVPTLCITFAVVLILGFALGAANMISIYDMMNSRGKTIVSFLAKIAPPYITNYDLSALDEFVKEVARNEDVALAAFYNKEGKVLISSAREELKPDGYLTFQQKITGSDDKPLGEFKVYYKKGTLFARLWQIVLWVTLGLGVSLLSLGIVVNRIGAQIGSILSAVSEQLTHSAQDLAASGEEINDVSQKLTSSSTEASASLDSTVSSMQQMNAMILQTTQNAFKGVERAQESQLDTVDGQKVVKAFEQAMTEIAFSNKKVESIMVVINQIQEKTKVIDDIVFQTKLLSFNASIEAARAGEYGKGFAVVAEEIGKLAHDSGRAAEEIGNLLGQSTGQVGTTIKETGTKVAVGQKASSDCAGVFKKIGNNIQSLTNIVNEISSASKEQEMGVDKTKSEMSVLADITEKNTQLAQQASDIAAYLQKQARALRMNIATLRNVVGFTGTEKAHFQDSEDFEDDILHTSGKTAA